MSIDDLFQIPGLAEASPTKADPPHKWTKPIHEADLLKMMDLSEIDKSSVALLSRPRFLKKKYYSSLVEPDKAADTHRGLNLYRRDFKEPSVKPLVVVDEKKSEEVRQIADIAPTTDVVKTAMDDMDSKWERVVIMDLSRYDINALKKAVNSKVDSRKVVSEIVKLIRSGVHVKLLPPLNYLRHFVGKTAGDARQNILSKLHRDTLISLALKMGFVTAQDVAVMTSVEIIRALSNGYLLVSHDQLNRMSKSEMKMLIRGERIKAKRASSVESLKQQYISIQTYLGRKIPLLHHNFDRADLATIASLHKNVRSPPRPCIEFKNEPNEMDLLTYIRININPASQNKFTPKPFDLRLQTPIDGKDNRTIVDMIQNGFYVKAANSFEPAYYPIEYLMVASDEAIDAIMESLGFIDFGFNWEEKIQFLLFRYMSALGPITPNHETMKMIAQTSTTALSRVVDIQTSDRPSLVWLYLTGQMPHVSAVLEIHERNFHRAVRRDAMVVMQCCKYFYKYYESGTLLSPYRFIAAVPVVSPFEIFVESLRDKPLEEVMNETNHFMMFPPSLNDEQRSKYFLRNISDYSQIFERKDRPPTPSKKDLTDKKTAGKIFEGFADIELFQLYDFVGLHWESRKDLLRQVSELAVESDPQWMFINGPHCTNRSTLKLNKEDRIVSFGTLHGYRSFTISELRAAFLPDKSQYRWIRYKNPSYNDPLHPKPNERVDTLVEFPRESIRQLHKLLSDNNVDGYFTDVKMCRQLRTSERVISSDLEDQTILGVFSEKTGDMARGLNYCSLQEREQFYNIIDQLFILAAYARYWKGPGFPFPHCCIPSTDEKCDYATPKQRTTLYVEAHKHVHSLIENTSQKVRDVLDCLNIIDYVWTSGNTYPTTDRVMLTIKAPITELSMNDIAERILQTAYYIIARLYRVTIVEYNTWVFGMKLGRFIPTLVNVNNP
jgi:hypothetical protein